MNQRDRRWSDDRLEHELRRALAGRAREAPLPVGLPDIPPRWVRAPSRAIGMGAIVKVVGVAVVAVAFAVLLIQLPRLAETAQSPFEPRVTTDAAASFLGVPAGQVIETRDGAVAIRLDRDDVLQAELHLVTATESGLQDELLSVAPVPLGVLAEGSELTWYERLSCAPERGLRQPNLFFGTTSPDKGIVVSEPSRTTREGRLYIIVLDEADLAGVEVDIGSNPAWFDEPANVGVNFDGGDPCTGEPPRSTLLERIP
jgi:hypothetical protein